MIPYTFEMSPKTHATMVGWVSKWRAILRIPGTKILEAALRNANVLELTSDWEVRRNIRDAEVILSKFEVKKTTARLDLRGLTTDQVLGLYWCLANARTGHGRQQKVLTRLAEVIIRFENRSPLFKLAECAE